MTQFQDIIKRTKAYLCLDCGKCTSVCPISILNENYTPRLLVNKVLRGDIDLLNDELLWSCISCGLCYERCESDVKFHEFIRDLRIEAYKIGKTGVYAHHGTMQSIMRMMTRPDLKQNRLDWLTKDLKVKIPKSEIRNPKSDSLTLYFVGCLPYFDSFFSNLQLNILQIAKSTIKILNHLGIEPVIMPNERCCGHDLLWTGDIENFKKLAQHNIAEINKTGAEKVLVSCPECYVTLKEYYPEYVAPLNAEIIHISELIAENLPELKNNGGTGFQPVKTHSQDGCANSSLKVTYQDPCRLGRFSNIYEQPRQIIDAMGFKLKEMDKNRKSAICCGTSGWMNCSTYSKQIQLARLKEAKNTGADLLITSCPKCQIHFKCAMSDKNIDKKTKIEIQDLTTLVANQLK